MKTNKGKPAMMCNGFVMRTDGKSKDGLRQYWRCTLVKTGCRGRAVSNVNSVALRETVAHSSHGASPMEAKVCFISILILFCLYMHC